MALILKTIVEAVLGKLIPWLSGIITAYEERQQEKKDAQAALQALKDAKTKEDIDAAAKDALGKF